MNTDYEEYMEGILKRLRRGEVIVGDGALGTMLLQCGLKHGEAPEAFNLDKPQVLEEIALKYLDAGAEIVSTNTFGASPLRLQQFSLENRMEAINRNAVEAVQRAVSGKAYVSGSVGPSSKMLKPLGDAAPEEIYSNFHRQLSVLLEAGIDLVCIETIMDVREAALAIQAAKDLNAKIPIMATATFQKSPKDFFTLMGTSVKDAAEALEKAGADIVGSNCGEGTDQMIEIARQFRQHARVPVAIQGNAGLPVSTASGLVYSETPDFVAAGAARLLDLGVQIIGGCCGTTPEHIRAIRKLVDSRR
jgi:5-methyltetrahydrofolate--homocysteine methyltransferase